MLIFILVVSSIVCEVVTSPAKDVGIDIDDTFTMIPDTYYEEEEFLNTLAGNVIYYSEYNLIYVSGENGNLSELKGLR